MGDSREAKTTPAELTSAEHDSKPAGPVRSTSSNAPPRAHDPSRAIELLLRNAIVTADRAMAETGEQSIVGQAIAAGELASSLREAAQFVVQGHADVANLAPSATAVLERARVLEATLTSNDVGTAANDLATASREFETAAPEAVHGALRPGQAVSLKPLTATEHIELATLALAAASEQLIAFRNMKGGDAEFRSQAIALCNSVVNHLARARDSALKVADRRVRYALATNVTKVSGELEYVNALLAEIPRQRWDRSFANAFDEENRLRAAVGLAPAQRSYTGTVDPQDAQKAVTGIANGGVVPAVDADLPDPASAVKSIAIGIHQMYARQIDAVTDLHNDLQEPELPKDESLFHKILLGAVELAITVATDGIAEGVSEKLGHYFEARDLGKLGPALEHLSANEREIVEDQLKKLPHAGRKIVMKTAKEGVLRVLKEPALDALKHETSDTHALGALNAFEQRQRGVLRDAQQTSDNQVAALGNALAQVDLETLKAMAATFNGPVAALARERQYRASAFAWQNLKAQAESGAYKKDDKDGSHGAKFGQFGVDGVLDVLADADSDPKAKDVRLTKLVLNGVEPAMRNYLKSKRFRISDVLLNRDYQVRWGGLSLFSVQFATGPDGRLRIEGISKRDLRLLKVYASGDKVTGANAFAAIDGEYDHVPDSEAIHVVHMFMNRLGLHTTADLEE